MAEETFWAHTPPKREDGSFGDPQTMREHTEGVTNRAVEFAASFGAEDLAKWASLLHDVGKFSKEFQNYLRQCHEFDAGKRSHRPKAGSAEHKCAGTKLALERLAYPLNEMLSLCIFGHHGGLTSRNGTDCPRDRVSQEEERRELDDAQTFEEIIGTATHYDTILQTPVPTLGTLPVMQAALAGNEKELNLEMLTRFVFSCLVDADSLDTEQHFQPEVGEQRSQYPTLANVDREWLETLDRNQRALQTKARQEANTSMAQAVQQVREEVYHACLQAAQQEPGIFKLTVPPGGGKTRSSLAFALAHAAYHRQKHDHSRIIYAIPYTSIIEQTADVFRSILGEENILEHHSAIDAGEDKKQDPNAAQTEQALEQKRRLAAQNWEAPLIVTTTVQLFESLFSNRTSRCRKLHNVVRSILILDEVQTLPVYLLIPLLDGLKTLVKHYGVTVVLCTATQPALDSESPYLRGFAKEDVREIIENPGPHFAALTRVRYQVVREPWSWERLAADVKQQSRSCLVILNTKKDALAVLDMLEGENVRHLSTLLCGTHRRDVLEEIKQALEAERTGNGKKIVLVTTQVVEAGVDVDFPLVYRSICPLSSAIQAAGRCNREGRRDRDECLVTLFKPLEGGMPTGEAYRLASELAWNRLTAALEVNLDDPETPPAYFEELFSVLRSSLDKKDVQYSRRVWDFQAVAEKVRLIEQDTIPVLVKYNPAAYDELLGRITQATKFGRGISRNLWQRLQPHLVAVNRHAQSDLMSELVPNQLWLWAGAYNKLKGIGGAAALNADDLICDGPSSAKTVLGNSS